MEVRFAGRFVFAVMLVAGICHSQASGQAKPPQPRTARNDVQPAGATSKSRVPPNERQAVDASQPAASARPAAQRPPAGQAPLKPLGPQVPFVLTPAEEKLLGQILLKWEKESAKVNTFTCTMRRWEYSNVFGAKQMGGLKSEADGIIKYKAPDRGDYSITSLREWDATKNALVAETEGLDHWVCDGKAIFEFDRKNKQLVERRLPPEMQGKAITDGPLPFVFGAKADQLKKRYWLKDITPRDQIGKQIWLEAHPKWQADAANFHHATLILTDPAFRPYALEIVLPDKTSKTAYVFENSKVNNPLAIIKGDFLPPMTPFGWKHVVDPEAAAAEKVAPPPPVEPAEAKRAAPSARRK